jgi:PAS domain S-box-containing protein
MKTRLRVLKAGAAHYRFILIFALLALGIIAGGTVYFRQYEKRYRAQIEQQLSSVGELKVGELVQWRSDRLQDAAIFFKNPSFSALVRRFFENPADVDAQRQLVDWLGKYSALEDYNRVRLLDAQGVTRLSLPADPDPSGPDTLRVAAEVLQSGQIAMKDFGRHKNSQSIYLMVMVPIFDESDPNRPLGVLALRIDPTRYLYPFISRWPTPSLTAETLLVRREGNEVVFLNELKFQTNTALNLRVSLESKDVPAVKAVLGQEGIVEGIDYRGVPVLADVRRVPDSPWFLVSRMDISEVYAPLRRGEWIIVMVIVILLFGAGAGVVLVWQQSTKAQYRALRESEARFRKLLRKVPLPLCHVTKEGVIEFRNERFVQVFGYTADEVPTLVEWWLRAYPDPQYRQWVTTTWDAAVARAAREGTDIAPTEYNVTCKNGMVRVVEISGITIGDDFLATFVDLTGRNQVAEETRRLLEQSDKDRAALLGILEDQKRAENSLRENTVFLNTLLDAMPVPVFYKDTEGRYIGFNRAFEAFFGKTHQELVGKSVFDIASRELAEVYHAKDIELFLNPGVQVYETEMKDSQGRMHDVVYHKATFTGADDQVRGLVGAIMDITDRKQAEDAISQSRDYLNQIINAIADPVFVKDDKRRFVLVNDALCAAVGRPRESLLGEDGDDMFPKEQVEVFRKMDAGVLDTGKENVNEESLSDLSSGEVHTIVTRKTRYIDPAGRRFLVGVIRDITDHKRAEEQIQKLNEELEQRVRDRTAQLEAANKELESFSYSVSHDLRAPLRSIDGFSQHVLEEYKDRLTEEGVQDLGRVRAAAQKMARLIDDMLALSRLTRQDMKIGPVDLSRVADDIASELHKTEPERKVEVVVAPGAMADGDERLLRQVMVNLLGNAWKFTRNTERARIEFGVLNADCGMRIAESQPDGLQSEIRTPKSAIYYVRDNGAGFDMAYAKKLFGAFQRLHSEKEFEGTGIGLAIVQRIIHRHGGKVWAESEVGKGTTFYFTI